MKYPRQWAVIPIAIASLLTTIALPALAENLSTPFQGQRRYDITSSPQSDQCNSANTQPEVVRIEVTEPLASLQFQVQGNNGTPTVRIRNTSTGREICASADNLSGSEVEVAAAWERGQYSVSVGDRNGETHNYTLSIRQN
ncbi:MAG: hypothetical protein F6K09_24080 [Merismopedia sp. SIO2A8]|nr:hypothetical protein [Symploca sp. SIO2B6]NET51672.1 hypothetical protein [Merismopedia sp. SIO2A8]